MKQALASKQLKSVYLDKLLSMQEERKQKKRDARQRGEREEKGGASR